MVHMDPVPLSGQYDGLLVWKSSRFHPDNEVNSSEPGDDSLETLRIGPLNCPVCQRSISNPTLGTHLNTNLPNAIDESIQCEELIRTLHENLHTVSLESVVLKSEIEMLRRAFDSKRKAVDILKAQNYQLTGSNLLSSTGLGNGSMELDRVRSESEGARNTTVAIQNATIQQLSEANEMLARQLSESERKVRDLLKENIYLMRNRRNTGETAIFTPTNKTRSQSDVHPPTLLLEDAPLFDFSDPNVNLSTALSSKSPSASSSTFTSAPTTPTVHVDRGRLSGDRIHSTCCDMTAARSSFPGSWKIADTTEQETQCELPTSVAEIPDQLSSGDLPELISCTCMPTGPALCECAVQAVRIQHKLLHCRHQLFKETNRTRELKLTIETYRIALDSQFKRNRSLSAELAAILSLIPTKSYQGTLLADHSIRNEQSVRGDGSMLPPSELSTSPSLDIQSGEVNAPKVLHDLLVWLHQNMDRVASTVNKLNSQCSCATRQNSARDVALYRRLTDNRRGSFDNLRSNSEDAEYRKLTRSSSRRQISMGSKRQVARVRDSRSMNDLRMGVDEYGTKESPSFSPSRFPHTSSPEQFRKRAQHNSRLTHAQGAAAKVRSRARSVELSSTPSTRDSSGDSARVTGDKNETKPTLSVMSELVMKLSELSELLAKQELISNLPGQHSFGEWR